MTPIEKKIPNLLTFGNLCCGFLAVLACLGGDLVMAGWLVFIAAVFDLFDGMAAKLLKAGSALGAQLDSLSDIVSFGLVPGLIAYMLLVKTHSPWLEWGYIYDVPVFAFVPFLIPAAGAYRLARYNTTAVENTNFSGLPIPAAAMYFASIPLMLVYNDVFVMGSDIYKLSGFVLSSMPLFLLVSVLLISWLMVSNISLFSLKLTSFKEPGGKMIILFLVISVVLFAFLLWLAVPVIILLYIVFSYFIKSPNNEIQSAD
jgi:CDP-diacylglycerol--serine O-phosphatidyltransferase